MSTSEFMRILRLEILGSTFDLIQYYAFADEDKRSDAKYKEELYDRLSKLFGSVNNDGDQKKKSTENTVEVFQKLREFPSI